jgi:hypothetical protein
MPQGAMAADAPTSHDAGRFERTWVLREQRESIERLQAEVAAALQSGGFGEAASFAIRLALEGRSSTASGTGTRATRPRA